MTEALGHQVTSYEHAPIGTGQMAQSHRVVPTYASGAIDTPVSLVAKLPSDDPTSRGMAQATGAYAREIGFYSDFAADLDVHTPDCYLARIADDGIEFVLLLEDLTPAEVLEQIGGATPEHARIAALEAAALHGSSWLDPRLTNDWVPGPHIWRQLGGAIPAVYEPFAARFGERVGPEHLDVVRRLGDEVGAWCDLLDEPTCLWHGDFRLDNLLFAAAGGRLPVAVVDWQSAMSGPPAIDVSYLLGTSLDPDSRRGCERATVTVTGAEETLGAPDELRRVLLDVVASLRRGNAITVAPHALRLSTQQAADLLGISRPTLVKLLEDGKIPFETSSRHRRVQLTDLLTYQEQRRRQRRTILDDLAAKGQELGLYDAAPNRYQAALEQARRKRS